jgi:hypothetical protein
MLIAPVASQLKLAKCVFCPVIFANVYSGSAGLSWAGSASSTARSSRNGTRQL